MKEVQEAVKGAKPRKAVICGAGGFIGFHLTRLLKARGYWVRGVDIKEPEFAQTAADDFQILDLRDPQNCRAAVAINGGAPAEVYQLAAHMGGMGFIHSAECEIMTNSALINIHMVNAAAAAGVPRYFFSSSVCVYRDQEVGDTYLTERDAYPALPDNEYGWEKLYAERLSQAFGRNRGMEVRIARFQNCYGPYGTWRGGREKAPAAICRKVAQAPTGGVIEVWGDGSALRDYIYIDDLCDGVYALMHSDFEQPTNIGTDELHSVDDLVDRVAETSGKTITRQYVEGPVGVKARYHSIDRILMTGWSPRHSFADGIAETYRWIEGQVRAVGLGPTGQLGCAVDGYSSGVA